MKTLCLLGLLTLVVCAVTASPVEEEHKHGENGWYIPQQDGSLVWTDIEDAKKILAEMEAIENELVNTDEPITFVLYTKKNPNTGQNITKTAESVVNSNFDAANPTRFLIHGWLSSHQVSGIQNIRNAWFTHDNSNIIAVDWAHARSINYFRAVAAIPHVATEIASMIDLLVNNFKMSLSFLEIIGHSLGAHVAGFAAKNVKSGPIHKIVGLDPAFPLFSYNIRRKRLSSTDAFYVESIQTNGGLLGFLEPIGKAAFYPNGGRSQPGCGSDVAGICSHSRAFMYYSEAIEKDNFPTIECEDYLSAVKKTCGSQYSPVRMGAKSNGIRVSGDYFVPVNNEYPYGKG